MAVTIYQISKSLHCVVEILNRFMKGYTFMLDFFKLLL
jgi:hypothetical protein